MVHLCISLIGVLVGFLAGVTRGSRGEVSCQLSGMALHFFALASFMWMLIEAMNILRNFVRVLPQMESKKNLTRNAWLAWLLPLGVVIVAGTVRPVGYVSEEYCWIAEPGLFYAAMLAPVAAMVTVNVAVLVAAMRKINEVSNLEPREEADAVQGRRGLLLPPGPQLDLRALGRHQPGDGGLALSLSITTMAQVPRAGGKRGKKGVCGCGCVCVCGVMVMLTLVVMETRKIAKVGEGGGRRRRRQRETGRA
jgi:hypothetical protein